MIFLLFLSVLIFPNIQAHLEKPRVSIITPIYKPEIIELMARELDENSKIDCIYNDYLVTEKPHETFKDNSYRWNVTLPEFKPHLLNLCITGPTASLAQIVHDRLGCFKDDFVAAGNWEFWNRIAKVHNLKNLSSPAPLYYLNPNGITTTNQNDVVPKNALKKMII